MQGMFSSFFLIATLCAIFVDAQQDAASSLLRKDFCPSLSGPLSCGASQTGNFTPVVTEALYGIKRTVSDLCEYTDGDCYQESTSSFCSSNAETCNIYPSGSFVVANCQNQIAQYLHLRYRCIPNFSSTIKNNNVCSDGDVTITDESGFISSPSYPTYVSVSNECTRKITVPSNKVINLWLINDLKFSDSNNRCTFDYVRITDTTGVYDTCGYQKYSYENKLCSSTIFVTYKAPASLGLSYKGFRLYYETVDRSTQPGCSTETPASPATPTAITTTTKPVPVVFDNIASGLNTITACKAEEKTITIPKNFVLFTTNVYYGVTSDLTCNTIGPQNCRSPASLVCNSADSCKLALSTNVPLADCGNKIANYIGAEYRFLPCTASSNLAFFLPWASTVFSLLVTSTRNFSVCDVSDVNATVGVITSPNFPSFTPNLNCQRKIIAPANRQIRVLLTDIMIEPSINNDCKNGYLSIKSECGEVKYCGDRNTIASRTFTTCSNILLISYVSSSPADSLDQFRGFNFYFEVVVPDATLPEIGQGVCSGGNLRMECSNLNPTTNFTVFVTEALYGIKSNSSNPCEYRSGDCYDPYSISCLLHADTYCTSYTSSFNTVSACQGKRPDYMFARYQCVPSYSNVIKNYNVCDKTLTDITDASGFISSPNFPSYINVNEECTIRVVAPANKVIKMWLFLDMKNPLQAPCSTDYIKITDTTGSYTNCGYKKVSYDKQLCSNVVYVSYLAPAVLSATLYRGFRIYYEFFDRSQEQDCPTGTPGSPTTPKPTTTTPQIVVDLVAKAPTRVNVCRGNETKISIPRNFTLFPIDLFYGVSETQSCKNISTTDCKAPAQFTFISDEDSVKVSLYNDVPLGDCNNKLADYIGFEYRFIPLTSSRNASVCDTVPLNLTTTGYGVMTQPNYPSFEVFKNCARQINAPMGRVVRIYVNDLFLPDRDDNGECTSSYLELRSACGSVKYCGVKPGTTSHASFIYTSCTSSLTVNYVSGNPSSPSDYRGFNIYYETTLNDAASEISIQEDCAGESISFSCDKTDQTTFTPYVSEAFFGLKSNISQRCRFVPGDCYEVSTSDYCVSTFTSCSVSNPYYKQLPKCQNKYADYLHARLRCVPTTSTRIKSFDICKGQDGDVTESKAFIQSPRYPLYTQVPEDCTRRIVAPSDKVIKLWVAVDITTGTANSCSDGAVKITDTTGTYSLCGYKKLSLDNQLCSSVVYASYTSFRNLSSLYKGFQLYYEFADRSDQPDCITGTPGSPTTPPTTTTTPQLVFDLVASKISKAFACLGNKTTIEVPNNFKLYPLDVYYGVSKDGKCAVSAQDCRSPATLNCQSEGTCTISLYNDVPVPDCTVAGTTAVPIATYIGLEYRFIPFVTMKNLTVCDSSPVTITNATAYGVITNPRYPLWEPNTACDRKLIAPNGKIIRVYLNDISVEKANDNGNCQNGYLRLVSDCSNVTYCGEKGLNGDYVFETCSQNLQISYVSSQSANNDYRGFNIYYEVAVKDQASALYTEDVCAGSSTVLKCESTFNTDFTVTLTEALNAVKPVGTNNTCRYDSNDCFAATSGSCITPGTTCSQYASSFTTMTSCQGRSPSYLHVRYKCIPFTSTVMPTFNICDANLRDITSLNGFITSPGYPTYQPVYSDCVAKIVAPLNKIVKIWIVESDIYSLYECANDYILVTDNTGSYKTCGYKKVSLEDQLCSSVVYVSYRTSLSSSSFYKGFKLYYEFVDRSLQPTCSLQVPLPPTTAASTLSTPTTTRPSTTKPLVDNLTGTTIFKTNVCKGASSSIAIPKDFQLFPINVYYGVTPNGTCNGISQSNCKAPADLKCSLTGSCTVSLLTDIPVADCQYKIADYIGLEYRLLPLVTSRNSTLCDTTPLQLVVTSSGVITSPGYPTLASNVNCARQLVAPAGRIIRVYISDLFIDYPDSQERCASSSLSFQSCSTTVSYCGEKSNGDYIHTSCDNTLTIQFTASNPANIFRGFNLYYEVTIPDAVSPVKTLDVCGGDTGTVKCDTSLNTNFTAIINEAFNGLKSNVSNKCGYTENDCYAPSTSSYCTTSSDSCSVFASSYNNLANCGGKYASYTHVRYRCVPYTSNVIKEYNICEQSAFLVENRGLISSPGYPTFTTVAEECTVKIEAPTNKIVNIWIPDINIKSPESNNDCLYDYVKITHNLGVFKACGSRKYQWDNRLCSSSVYVTYKAPNRTSSFKGFKLYYEFVDRSTQPNCPTEEFTTVSVTPSKPTTKPLIHDVAATEITRDHVCRGNKLTLTPPSEHNLFVIDFYYGVSADKTCQNISPNDCKSPLEFPCSTDSECQIPFYNDVPVADCGDKIADYIGIEYRYIPLYSSKNHTICNNDQPIQLVSKEYGVITSPNYPTWTPNIECRTRLVAPADKIIRVYVNDLNIENDESESTRCRVGHLGLEANGVEARYCGDKFQSGSYVYLSCSNSLTVTYKSSAILSSQYRGFNLYYEVIDKQNIQCSNVTEEGERSTRGQRTTRKVTLLNNMSNHSSNHLTGWSLGLGIPLFIALIVIVLYFVKRMGRGASGEEQAKIKFSALKDRSSSNFYNPNFTE